MLIVTCKRYLGRFLLGIKLLLPKLVVNLLHSLCHRYHQDFKTNNHDCVPINAANIKSIPGLGGGNYGDFFPLFLCSRSRKRLLIVSCHQAATSPAHSGTVKAHSDFSWHSQCRHETEREKTVSRFLVLCGWERTRGPK